MNPMELHTALLQACPDEVVSAVVKLHAPATVRFKRSEWAECEGCDHSGSVDDTALWPCRTIRTINAYAHVDGIEAL